jgi:hypothetical protein
MRRYQCAQCGRDVRDLPDSARRFEGGSWYCSQSCFLEHESAASRTSAASQRRPKRRWRRRVAWTVGIIVALIVGLAILGAFVSPDNPKKAGENDAAASASAREPVVPFGHFGGVGDHWRIRVVSARRNATALIVSLSGQYAERPPAGAQYYLVKIAARYTGGGSSTFGSVVSRLSARGVHKAPYSFISGLNACGLGEAQLPEPDAGRLMDKQVFSGHGLSGNICFEIASNDASSLRLYLDPTYSSSSADGRRVWFALR